MDKIKMLVLGINFLLLAGCMSLNSPKAIILLNSNRQADLSGMVKVNEQFSYSGQSCLELYGKYPTEIIAANYIELDPTKSYTLSAWVRSLTAKLPASAYLGIRMYDKDKREIRMVHVSNFPNTESKLTVAAKKGDRELFIAKNPHCLEIVTCVMVFNIKPDYSDLPNYDFSPRIKKIVDNGKDYKVILSGSLNKAYPVGTAIRLHSPWGAPLYNLAEGWVPTEWKHLTATLQGIAKFGAPKDKFWPGTKYVKPFIWFGNWNRKPKQGAKLLIDDFTFTKIGK
ncbi:MAG: hypothetical protein L3J71_18500 [Victivallaceae bacterium]|nr:hypothetical protein [Victivallaceae bacterium]